MLSLSRGGTIDNRLFEQRGKDFFLRMCCLISRTQPFVDRHGVYCVQFTSGEARHVSQFERFVASVTATVRVCEQDFQISLLPIFPRVGGLGSKVRGILTRPILKDRAMSCFIYEMRLPQEVVSLLAQGGTMDFVCFSFASQSRQIPLQALIKVQFDIL